MTLVDGTPPSARWWRTPARSRSLRSTTKAGSCWSGSGVTRSGAHSGSCRPAPATPARRRARTAERELAEETGLRASSLSPLATAPLTPGYSTEVMHFFLATGLTEGPTDRDVDERMDVAQFDRDGVAGLIRDGEVDVKTIAGLALAGWSSGRRCG